MTLTIAIPTFNRPELCMRAILSAVDQEVDAEILIVDNHSDGVSYANLEAFVASIENKKIRLLRNETNLGMFGNFNRCLELCETEWITFLCDDDQLEKNGTSKFTPYLNDKYDHIHFKCYSNRESLIRKFYNKIKWSFRRSKKLHYCDHLMTNKYTGFLGVVFRTNAIKKIKFDEGMYPSADYDVAVNFALQNRSVSVNIPVGIYNHGDNASLRNDTLNGFIKSDIKIIKRLSETLGVSPRVSNKFIGHIIQVRIKEYIGGWNGGFVLDNETLEIMDFIGIKQSVNYPIYWIVYLKAMMRRLCDV